MHNRFPPAARIFTAGMLAAGALAVLAAVTALSSCASAPGFTTARTTGIRGPNAPQLTADGVVFRISAPEATVVNIAGQFNGWSPEATEMTKGEDGVWTVTLALKTGALHRYKYLIDGFWIPDPENPDCEPDGCGGYNSIIDVK